MDTIELNHLRLSKLLDLILIKLLRMVIEQKLMDKHLDIGTLSILIDIYLLNQFINFNSF